MVGNFLLKLSLFRGHVSFRGSTSFSLTSLLSLVTSSLMKILKIPIVIRNRRTIRNPDIFSLSQWTLKKKGLNFIFPTKYVIPKGLKFSHWPSKFTWHVFFGWNCWWKKSGEPVEVGSLSHYLQGFSTIPGGFLAGFLNHQQNHQINDKWFQLTKKKQWFLWIGKP